MTDAGPAQPRTWRRWLRAAWLAAALLALAVALVDRWEAVRDSLAQLSAPVLAVSLVTGLAGVAAGFAMWRTMLAGLGAPLGLRAGARVFFVGQLGKFLPGGVWPLLAQMDLARDFAVPARASAAAVALFMWAHLVTAAAAAAIGLGLGGAVPVPWALGAVPALALLHPAALGRALSWGLRRLGREPLAALPDIRRLMAATLWGAGIWIAWGVHIHVLLDAVGADVSLLRAAGVFAAAWAAGLLFLPAPAGIGVREAVMIALLAGVASTGPVLAVAAVSRLLLTVADLLWGLLGLGVASSSRRLPAADRPQPPAGDG